MERKQSPIGGVLFFLLGALAASSTVAQALRPAQRAVAIEPIQAILDAFRSHSLVALAEGAHGNEQGHAFRLSLVRDARFAATVNDIVVEFGNSRYQDLMDRFVRGEDVADESLRQVWQNTTQPHPAWDAPIYEDFFRALRAVNSSLPHERQIRVLLGDPPIDWDAVRGPEDLRKWGGRGRHAAEIIRREVLQKQRRALILYGDGHLFRVPMTESLVSVLESSPHIKIFTIASPFSTSAAADRQTLQADMSSWPVPALTVLRGTVLGAAAFTFYYPPPQTIRGGTPVAGPVPDQWRSLRIEDQFDALLYLGPPSSITTSQMSRRLCSDDRYMEMRLRRMALSPVEGQIDRLKQYCSAATSKGQS